jgi:hypothetical protein
VLELVVFTQEVAAGRTVEKTPSTGPHIPIALDTLSLLLSHAQRTFAGMLLQTSFAVAHPGFAEVTDGSNHCHSYRVCGLVLDHAVTTHTLDLPTLGTHNNLLIRLTEIAERTVSLSTPALIALHLCITGHLSEIGSCQTSGLNQLLSITLLFCLLPLPCFSLRHFTLPYDLRMD